MSISINNLTRTVTISSVGKPGPRGPVGDITPEAEAALEEINQTAIVVADNARQTAEDREATSADARATAEDRLQTGRDVEATADDRRQTGEDRDAVANDATQTAEDRAATAADVLLTNADAEATSDDRRQTGEDRVATAADRAEVEAALEIIRTEYVVYVIQPAGTPIPVGQYLATASGIATGIFDRMVLKVPTGSGSVSVQLVINGVPLPDIHTVTNASPVVLNGLSISITQGDTVSFAVLSATASQLWAQITGLLK